MIWVSYYESHAVVATARTLIDDTLNMSDSQFRVFALIIVPLVYCFGAIVIAEHLMYGLPPQLYNFVCAEVTLAQAAPCWSVSTLSVLVQVDGDYSPTACLRPATIP